MSAGKTREICGNLDVFAFTMEIIILRLMRTYRQLHNLWHHESHVPKTLTLLYAAYVVRTAIFSFLSIYLPIYYYQSFLKASLKTEVALTLTLILFIIVNLLHVLASFASARMLAKQTLKKLMLGSIVVLLVFCLLLVWQNNSFTFFLSAIILGIHSGIWWETYHLDFSLNGKVAEFGKEIGLRQGLGILTAIGSPVLAGLLISYFGYPTLFIVTAFLVLSLNLIVCLTKDQRQFLSINNKEILSEIKKYRTEFIANLGVGGEAAVSDTIWPLVLFMVIREPLLVGMTSAIVALIAFIMKLVTGKIVDLQDKNKVEYYGAVGVAVTWFGKLVIPTFVGLVFFDILYNIINSFFYIPLIALSYLRSLGENKPAYITTREMIVQFGKALVLLIAALLIMLGVPLIFLLILGVLFPLFSFRLRNNYVRQ